MKHYIRFILASGLALTGLGLPLWAEQAPAGNLTRAYTIQVKPGQAAAFEAGVKKHMAWRRQQGDPWRWKVYQVVAGPGLGSYAFRSSGHTWADFDAVQDFMDKGSPHFSRSVGSTVESTESSISRSDPKATRWDETTVANYVRVFTFRIRRGHERDFSEAVHSYGEALSKANWAGHYTWGRPVIGGRPGTASVAVPSAGWADMKPPERSMASVMREIYGAEGAKALAKKFQESAVLIKSVVVRLRPDLSSPK